MNDPLFLKWKITLKKSFITRVYRVIDAMWIVDSIQIWFGLVWFHCLTAYQLLMVDLMPKFD